MSLVLLNGRFWPLKRILRLIFLCPPPFFLLMVQNLPTWWKHCLSPSFSCLILQSIRKILFRQIFGEFNISSPISLSLSSQLFCPHRKYYARASFSLSLHYRNTSTLLCMLFLDTTMKCKVNSNGLITSKARVGFGRKLQIFKPYFFWSIGHQFHTSIQRG